METNLSMSDVGYVRLSCNMLVLYNWNVLNSHFIILIIFFSIFMTRNDTTHASTYVKIVHHPPVARRVCHFSNSFLSYYTDFNSLCNTGKDIEVIKYLHSGKKLFYEDWF